MKQNRPKYLIFFGFSRFFCVGSVKKFLALGTLFTIVLFSVHAQGFYFDAGLGIGGARTEIDGIDMSDAFTAAGVDFTEVWVDLALKAGYGPIANMPLYIVGTIGGLGHRLEDYNSDYYQFNSYIIGPGVIFYPISFIQLAGSIGYSFTRNQTSLPLVMAEGKGGFAGDISAAFDFSGRNHGWLLGLKYFRAVNTLETGAEQNSSGVSVFVRYIFKHRIRA
ncbi:MAG: hypothetical protein LBQ61_07075 [Spirochaetales bacterium]|jgi:hypothetical protein|nr:hypothetical protein [Spirochaetales bacterium]